MTQSRHTGRVVSRAVIKALAVAGATAGVVIAPNSVILIEKYLKHIDKKNAQRTLHYLKYRNLVEVKEVNGQLHYRLTKKGRDKYERMLIDELSIATPRRWDGKWRLVMFDIPVEKRRQRDELLNGLKQLNFYMLQQSAWIHPFDCEKQIAVMIQYFGLERNVSFMVVEEGNFVEHASRHFKKTKLLM